MNRTYRAIKDPLYGVVDGHAGRWTIERRRWYGWSSVCVEYGDDDRIKQVLANLCYPQVITVYGRDGDTSTAEHGK